MDQIYAIGVSCIEFIQEWFEPYETYFRFMNELANQYHVTETIFPLVSIIFDSVFASQLLLCMAFGGWLNAVMKWWLLEDRPYWWVRETSYYTHRPTLRQTEQTCETGPGCPSGHSATVALTVTLFLTCAAHVATDRHWKIPPYIQKAAYILCGIILMSVFLARMYVAAHFPHQVLLGGIIGLFLGPALCIYVSDPYIWCYGHFAGGANTEWARRWHVASALGAAAVAVVTYWGLVACDHDPQRTIKLAFRWCESPENIQVKTTPIFSLVQCCGYLLGWAVAVTPAVAKYRHDTKNRSIIISAFLTYLTIYTINYIDENLICKNHTFEYYSSKFVIFTFKPLLFLRVIPALSMWPYANTGKVKTS